MDKKLSELTVREALALITVLAVAFEHDVTGGYIREKYESALARIDNYKNANCDK